MDLAGHELGFMQLAVRFEGWPAVGEVDGELWQPEALRIKGEAKARVVGDPLGKT